MADVARHDEAGNREFAHRNPPDRLAAIQWARRLLAAPDAWVVLDTETTGLGITDEIIQIAILAPGGAVLFDSLVKPLGRTSIPSEAAAVHGITIEMLAGAPTFPQIAPRLCEVVGARTVIAYNAEYDRRMLAQTAVMSGARAPHWTWDCAMIQYARFVGEWNPRRGEYRYQRLRAGDHSAAGDCRATLKLIAAMASA
jgi:DNA polymerase III subunit epsilon